MVKMMLKQSWTGCGVCINKRGNAGHLYSLDMKTSIDSGDQIKPPSSEIACWK